VSDDSAPTRDDSILAMSLSSLRFRCAEESDRFFRRQDYDPRYCFELFRRAIVGQEQRAWELVYRQYKPLVSNWVGRNSLSHTLSEEAEYFVNRAFEKFWSAITPEKFDNFGDLKALLRYLQMCVHSVLVDTARMVERAQLLAEEADESGSPGEELEPDPEELAQERARNADLWHWINERLKDERERCVLYGSFVLEMKPAEIFQAYRAQFASVREVYTVKDNLLARLRRDDELLARLRQE
jgi:DNA-directed RNA polymerase specialized sigma24 family protein